MTSSVIQRERFHHFIMMFLSCERIHRASHMPSEYRDMSRTKSFCILLSHETCHSELGVAFCKGWSVGYMHESAFILAKTLEETKGWKIQIFLKVNGKNNSG